MKDWQFFVFLASVYLSPTMPRWLALVVGGANLLLALVVWL